MKYVIIGNSAAGIGGVEGIRQKDDFGKITIISDEKYHTYSRPLISYLLEGKTDLQKIKYRPLDFYEKNGCECLFDVKVTKIDGEMKCVTLSDGKVVPYDKLLVATGSRPFIPPFKGFEEVKNKFTFMSLDDALALNKAVKKSSRVLIVGAGLIGLKCAEGIYGKCKSITVVDLAPKVLPSILDDESSCIVKSHIEKQGVKFILSDSVKEFRENEAILESGKKIQFDILVICVGVRPNVSLVEDAGGKVNRGIAINEKCETTLEDVYAAGDCALSYDISSESEKILAILPGAFMQGETAGINMAGGNKTYDNAIPMNSIGFWGLHIITAGSYDGEEYIEKDGLNYKKLVTKDNLLKGFILTGDIKRAGIYTRLIRERTPLDSIDWENVKKSPTLIAAGINPNV